MSLNEFDDSKEEVCCCSDIDKCILLLLRLRLIIIGVGQVIPIDDDIENAVDNPFLFLVKSNQNNCRIII